MRKRVLVLIGVAFLMLVPAAARATDHDPGNSGAADECQQGGYRGLIGVGGETFRNEGECVSYRARGGTFVQGIIIPQGSQAILSNASFGGACDPLSYGYQVGDGPFVVVDSKPLACPYTDPVAGATIGPFDTAVLLRVVLEDTFCGGGPEWTFYSDGNHAVVTETSPGTFEVGIHDSFFCQFSTNEPRPPAPGSGDLRVTVTIV